MTPKLVIGSLFLIENGVAGSGTTAGMAIGADKLRGRVAGATIDLLFHFLNTRADSMLRAGRLIAPSACDPEKYWCSYIVSDPNEPPENEKKNGKENKKRGTENRKKRRTSLKKSIPTVTPFRIWACALTADAAKTKKGVKIMAKCRMAAKGKKSTPRIGIYFQFRTQTVSTARKPVLQDARIDVAEGMQGINRAASLAFEHLLASLELDLHPCRFHLIIHSAPLILCLSSYPSLAAFSILLSGNPTSNPADRHKFVVVVIILDYPGDAFELFRLVSTKLQNRVLEMWV